MKCVDGPNTAEDFVIYSIFFINGSTHTHNYAHAFIVQRLLRLLKSLQDD